MAEKPAKRPRTAITTTVEKDICQYKLKNPMCTQASVLEMVAKRHRLSIGRLTVSDILKESPKWLLREDSDDTKKRQPLHEKMEEALMLWFSSIRSQKVAVSDDILKMKAKNCIYISNSTNFNPLTVSFTQS